MAKVALIELNIELRFIAIFENFYDNSIYKDVSHIV